MNSIVLRLIQKFEALRDLPPLIFRLILAYGFFEPALKKWSNIGAVGDWFGSMGIPFPHLNAYMAASTEALGIVLVTIGLATRFISIPMMFIMIVAVATVHYQHGFSCGKNGFEVPFYYFFMLFSLVVTGAGKFSLDYLIKRKVGSV